MKITYGLYSFQRRAVVARFSRRRHGKVIISLDVCGAYNTDDWKEHLACQSIWFFEIPMKWSAALRRKLYNFCTGSRWNDSEGRSFVINQITFSEEKPLEVQILATYDNGSILFIGDLLKTFLKENSPA